MCTKGSLHTVPTHHNGAHPGGGDVVQDLDHIECTADRTEMSSNRDEFRVFSGRHDTCSIGRNHDNGEKDPCFRSKKCWYCWMVLMGQDRRHVDVRSSMRYDSQTPTTNSMAPDSQYSIIWVSGNLSDVPCAIKPGCGLVKEPAHTRNFRSAAETSMSKNTPGTAHLHRLPALTMYFGKTSVLDFQPC
jgi:hypothetical protein